jgi:hypothetical protein
MIRGARPASVRDFETDVAGRLVEIARRAAAQYDLSPDTARALSAGVKGFKPHGLLNSRCKAKTGGLQKKGICAVDRYISYRIREDIISLGVLLNRDESPSMARYQVLAPRALLPDPRPIEAIRPGAAADHPISFERQGQTFSSLDEAATVFESVLAKVAPSRRLAPGS